MANEREDGKFESGPEKKKNADRSFGNYRAKCRKKEFLIITDKVIRNSYWERNAGDRHGKRERERDEIR